MEPTNEEQVELGRLRDRKFWCIIAIIGGVALAVSAAIGEATQGVGLIGLVLIAAALFVRSRATHLEQLIRARQRDRANQTVVGPHQGQ